MVTGSSGGSNGAFACARVQEEAEPLPTVFCWGANRNGQLGHGTGDNTCATGPCNATPTPVFDAGKGSPYFAHEIDAGNEESICLRTGGAVYCWGYGGYGIADSGAVSGNTFVPQSIAAPQAASISVGATHACSLGEDDVVACWGVNGQGQLGDGTTDGDMDVNCLDDAPCHVDPVEVIAVRASQIAAGLNATFAIDRDDAGLYAWGWNGYANLGHEPGTGDDITCGAFACDPVPRAVEVP